MLVHEPKAFRDNRVARALETYKLLFFATILLDDSELHLLFSMSIKNAPAFNYLIYT